MKKKQLSRKQAVLRVLLMAALSLLLCGCRSSVTTDTSKDVPVSPYVVDPSEKKDKIPDLVISQVTDSEIVFSTEMSENPDQELAGEAESVEDSSEDAYAVIVQTYRELFNARAYDNAYVAEKLNDLTVEFYADNTEKNSYEVGYALLDIDGDESKELLVGVNSEFYKGTMILGLYTREEQDAVLVCSSDKESIYYLGSGNHIYNKTTAEGGSKYYYKFHMDGKQLTGDFSFAYDEGRSLEDPWFTSIEGKEETISKDDAKDMVDEFYGEMAVVDLRLFTEE